MVKPMRIPQPEAKKGRRFDAQAPDDASKQTIAFSLERVLPGDYCFSELCKDDKAQVAEAMFRRRAMTWNDVTLAPKHGLGTEKIPKGQIHAPLPVFITEDITDFLVLRFNGKKPMVGYRQGRIYYVLWFDHNFSLYDHGR